MAYDEARACVVMLGGLNTTTLSLGDTWEWDGNTWRLRASIDPGPRSSHAMAYDATRGCVVLFGGRTNVSGGYYLHGDTREYALVCGSGDMNEDGLVTPDDLPAFVAMVLGEQTLSPVLCDADMNGDVLVNGADIRLFVEALTN
jgi:hypothetical protein